MNVLHISKYYYPFIGGMENHIALLATELYRNGIDVTVLTSNTNWRTTVDKIDGIKVIRVSRLFDGFATPFSPTLPFHIKKIESTIIHIHLVNPMAEIATLLACPGGTLIVSYHLDVTRSRRIFQMYEPVMSKLLEKAQYILAGSLNFIQSSQYLRRFQNKCLVVPYGIDLSQFDYSPQVASQSESIRSKYSSPIILFVGRLTHYKGLTYLLEAMKKVEAHLLIVGDGDLMESLKADARRFGVMKKATFLGKISGNIAPYFYACDVFVLPSISRAESFGLVQLEAHACGKPVVCTEIGTGTSFANKHGETGFVVEPRSPDALAKAINTLLSDSR